MEFSLWVGAYGEMGRRLRPVLTPAPFFHEKNARTCLWGATFTVLKGVGTQKEHTGMKTLRLLASCPYASVVVGCVIPLFMGGCETPQPIPIALDYSVRPADQPAADLHGLRLTLAPFADSRTNRFLFHQWLVMREGDDAGVWVANAIKNELEYAGASVEPVERGVRPLQGVHMDGQLNVLTSEQHGWTMGGVLGMATAGITAKLDLTVEVLEDGVPSYTKQYAGSTKYKSEAGVFFGQQPQLDVPRALPEALRELVRTKIIPDLAEAMKVRTSSLHRGTTR